MTDRLIGDCLELNGEINEKIFNSKFPKFIKNFQKKYYTKKMMKIVDKISDGNTPLNRSNIIELATYLNNNYQPTGSFSNIKHVKYFSDSDTYLMRLEFDESIIVFNIPNAGDKNIQTFICKIVPKNSIQSYEVELKEMVTDNNEIRHILIDANAELLNIISQYILEIIGKY